MIPVPRMDGADVVAEVLWVDHFGNAQLNLGPEDVAGWDGVARLQWGDEVRTATVVTTYDEIGTGAIGLVLDSYGLLALSLMRRSAADELGLAAGTEIRLSPAVSGGSGGRRGWRADHARRPASDRRSRRAFALASPPCARPPRSPLLSCWWPSSWPAWSAWSGSAEGTASTP